MNVFFLSQLWIPIQWITVPIFIPSILQCRSIISDQALTKNTIINNRKNKIKNSGNDSWFFTSHLTLSFQQFRSPSSKLLHLNYIDCCNSTHLILSLAFIIFFLLIFLEFEKLPTTETMSRHMIWRDLLEVDRVIHLQENSTEVIAPKFKKKIYSQFWEVHHNNLIDVFICIMLNYGIAMTLRQENKGLLMVIVNRLTLM